MALMEFLSQNLILTTTMIKLDSNTALSSYIFNRNKRLTYQSSGYSGVTATVISIELGSPQVLSHILIQNHNLQSFRAFYNSVTANSLGIVSGNSATSTYLSFASVTVSSVQLQMDMAIGGASEKSVGELILAERELVFERNPSIRDWKQMLDRKQIEHTMPDGGTVLFNIRDKYKSQIAWEFVTSTFHENLRTVFDAALPVYFVPRPTTTAWDGNAYECAWVGGFDFNFAENSPDNGYSGSISLKETPGG